MDSEQAVWAREWLQKNGRIDYLETGWTYIFEAVYRDNVVIVPYMFEGLVLLGAQAVSPHGVTLTSDDIWALGTRLGVMSAPFFEGELEDVIANVLSASMTRLKDTTVVRCPPLFEGWVLDVNGTQYKYVSDAYKRASLTALSLHPQVVWRKVRYGATRASLFKDLPVHFCAELDAILCALDVQFQKVKRWVQATCAGIHAWDNDADDAHAGSAVAASNEKASSQDRDTLCFTAALDFARSELGIFTEETSQVSESGSEARSGPCEDVGVLRQAMATLSIDSAPLSGEHVSETCEGTSPALLQAVKALSIRDVSQPQGLPAKHVSEACEDVRLLQAANTLHACLTYALDKKKIHPMRSMYYDQENCNEEAPHLRVVIVDCIKPRENGALFGYTPTQNMVQTFCKGWATGPPLQMRVKVYADARIHVLEEGVLTDLFLSDTDVDICTVANVCRYWHDLVHTTPRLQEAHLSSRNRRKLEKQSLKKRISSDFHMVLIFDMVI